MYIFDMYTIKVCCVFQLPTEDEFLLQKLREESRWELFTFNI